MPPAKQTDIIICACPVLEALICAHGQSQPSFKLNVYIFLYPVIYLLSNHLSIIIFLYKIITVL